MHCLQGGVDPLAFFAVSQGIDPPEMSEKKENQPMFCKSLPWVASSAEQSIRSTWSAASMMITALTLTWLQRHQTVLVCDSIARQAELRNGIEQSSQRAAAKHSEDTRFRFQSVQHDVIGAGASDPTGPNGGGGGRYRSSFFFSRGFRVASSFRFDKGSVLPEGRVHRRPTPGKR